MNLYAFGPAIADTFLQPKKTFEAIKNDKLSAVVALALLLFASLCVFGWYFLTVDIERFVLSAMMQSGQNITADQLGAIKDQESVIRMTSIIGAVVTQVGLIFVFALYLFLVATVTSEHRVTYGQWLSLAAWSGLPVLLGFLSIGVGLAFVQGAFVPLEALDQTSLNNTLFHLEPSDSGYTAANALSAGGIWSWILYVLGFSYLTESNRVTATLVVAIPVIIIFGLLLLL